MFPQRSCKYCAVPDTDHWSLVQPEVTYSLSSPAGSFECSESGLRWKCSTPVTLQYCFKDWHVFAEEMDRMQARVVGPPMDIRLISGELEELHVPHLLCLEGWETSVPGALKVLHKQDGDVIKEECEQLTRHHVKLLRPSFSLLGPVCFNPFSFKVHCQLLLFCTSVLPLTLRVYLLPNDPGLIEAIKTMQGHESVEIKKPSAIQPLQLEASVQVRTSCPSQIFPERLRLWRFEANDFCEVKVEQPGDNFDLLVAFSENTQPIWRGEICRKDWEPTGF